MRFLFTDELWAAFAPLAEKAKKYRDGQRPRLPDRLFFEALLYWARPARRLRRLGRRNVFPNIPNRRNRVDPWPFMPEGYRERNRVERLFGKAKQFRRLATRYEKLKETFLGMIHLVLGFIRLRKLANVNTS